MIKEIKNIKTGKKELKQFAYVMFAGLTIIASVLFFKHKQIYIYFAAAGLFFLFSSFIYYKILVPFHYIWMSISVIIGWIMTRIILGLLFFIIMTPIGLIGRLLGKKFLDEKFQKNTETYWIKKQSQENINTFERQF